MKKIKVTVSRPYDESRRAAYPSIQEQLDNLYHAISKAPSDIQAYFSGFTEPIRTVKKRYPKP